MRIRRCSFRLDLYWDTLRLFHEIRRGLAIAGRDRKLKIDAIGVDTWGVDFALLGEDGALVDNPHHYRDARNNGVPEKTFGVVPKAGDFRGQPASSSCRSIRCTSGTR